MGSRGRPPDDDSEKDTHISVRVSPETAAYLDAIGKELGHGRENGSVNRSATLRSIIKIQNGILFGSFYGIIDPGAMRDEWGDVGHLIAAALSSDMGVPEGLENARLADVMAPIPVIERAAEVELEETDEPD